jgi:hypothetical protein
MEIWNSLTQSILSGLAAALFAQGFFYFLIRRGEKRRRRREVVVLVAQCGELIRLGRSYGAIANQWADRENAEFSEMSKQYWSLGTRALSLFEVREQVVARWTEIELAAGHAGLFYFLQESAIPAEAKAAQDALNGLWWDGASVDDPVDYGPPRASMLADWAELRSSGPLYGSLGIPGDESRHHIVIPNSDVELPERVSPVHELAPQGTWLRGRWSEKRKARFLRRLEKRNSKEWSRRHRQSRLTRWFSKLSWFSRLLSRLRSWGSRLSRFSQQFFRRN